MKKIYSESEVSPILLKAAEIQERDNATNYTSGVTLDELQRIARELGISDAALQAALTQPAEETKSSFLNLIEEQERVFDGELDMDRLDEVVEVLGEGVRLQVMPHVGRTLKAQVSAFGSGVFGTLEIVSRNGRTKLKFRQTPFVAYFAGLHIPLILSIVGAANFMAHGMVLAGLLSMLGLLAIGFSLFYFIAQGGKKKARKLVDKMADRLGGLIAEHQSALPNLGNAKAVEQELPDRLNQGA